MAGESQKVPEGKPDPSVMTTEQLDRAIDSLRDFIVSQLAIRDQRFEGIDKATKVLDENVNRFPTEIQKEVGHLKELTNEAMRSAQALVKYQTECTDKAAAKQEAAFTKQIGAIEVLLQTTTNTLSDRINVDKTRLDRIESGKLGGNEQRNDSRAAMAFAITVGFFVLAIVGFIITQVATTPSP